MINLNKVLAKFLSCPLVIETGTSSFWRYRKWSDGRAECWGIYSKSLASYQTWNSTYDFYPGALSFPTNLFVEQPVVQYSSRVGSGWALSGTITNGTSGTAVQPYAASSESGTQTCYWYIYAIGRWK